MRALRAAAAVAAAMLAACAARGQAHAGDVILRVFESRIETGTGVPSQGTYAREGVFVVRLGAQGVPNFASNPGFDSEAGTFPTPSSVGFDMVDRLYYWNGGTFEATGGERVQINFGATAVASGEGYMAGFSLAVSGGGAWHYHLGHLLQRGTAPAIDDGVYMLGLELHGTGAGVGRSRPFYLLYDQNAGNEAVMAAEWFVRTRVLPPVVAGDTNGDGRVDFVDLNRVLSEFGSAGQWLAGDVNRDGVVNFVDLNIVLGAFGS